MPVEQEPFRFQAADDIRRVCEARAVELARGDLATGSELHGFCSRLHLARSRRGVE